MVSHLESSIIFKAVAGDIAAQEQRLLDCRPLIRVAARRHLDKFWQHWFDESNIIQRTCKDAHATLPSFCGQSYPELLCWLQKNPDRNIWRIREAYFGTKRDVRREGLFEDGPSGLSFIRTTAGKADSSPLSKLILGETALIGGGISFRNRDTISGWRKTHGHRFPSTGHPWLCCRTIRVRACNAA